MEKSLENFHEYFTIAVNGLTVVSLDYNLLTLEDLKQECYLTYAKIKCTNESTYPGFMVQKLRWVIIDYCRRITKSRNKFNTSHNVSLEFVVAAKKRKDHDTSSSLTIGDTLKTPDKKHADAEIIAVEVLDSDLLTEREKEFFYDYFINDMTGAAIAEKWELTPAMISLYKKQVITKLKEQYINEK